MGWVRAEYAGELAVVSTWIAVLLPWSVSYSSGVSGGTVLFVRFPFFQVRHTVGIPIARSFRVMDPLSATAFQAGQSIQIAYQVWTLGALVLAVAALFSVAYYAREDAVEGGPVDPVEGLGTLLAVAGAVLALATYFLLTRGFPGVVVPVGVVFLLALGGVLVRIDR